jgi:hypothetical protein
MAKESVGKVKIILALLAVFLLAGCTVKVGSFDVGSKMGDLLGLVKINDKAPADLTNDLGGKTREEAKGILDKGQEMSEEAVRQLYGASIISQKLTAEDKAKIDGWILGKGLNEYGDPKDTVYAGGTPLFDERTGLKIDKYEYILTKHPDLITDLNLKK